MSQPYAPVVNAGLLYAQGLQLAWTSSSGLTINSGAARDSSNVNDIVLGSLVSVASTSVGLNGVDVAAAVSASFYGVYVIGDSTNNNPVGGLLSLNVSSAPTLPFGYDLYRRIGWISTSAANAGVLKFYQYGVDEKRSYYYDVGITALTTGSSSSFALINLGASVPPIATTVNFDISYTPATSAGVAQFLPYGSSAANGIVRFGCGTSNAEIGSIVVPCQLSSGVPEVQYKVGASDSLTLLTVGYSDFIS